MKEKQELQMTSATALDELQLKYSSLNLSKSD